MSSTQNEKHERQVAFREVPHEEAREATLQHTGASSIPAHAVKDAKVEFDSDNTVDPKTKEMTIHFKNKFPSFNAEHSVIEGDIIIHFYLPKHAKQHLKGDNNPAEQQWMEYWLKKFPSVLDPVARKYFDAEYPRLQVKYTKEVASWWFKGQGYDKLIDPAKFVREFLVKLDSALREHS